ncbi:MAG: FixH family protein [Emcibacter sp.]|nr:FixH family protein [Emcibacter sp.]
MTASTETPEEKPVKKFTGKKALMWIVGFFLIIFAVNAIVASIAVGTWGGLETKDAYRKGLYYNDEIAAAEEQKKSGWKIFLRHSPRSLIKGSQDARLDVEIIWPESDLPPAQVIAVISRAVTNAYDQKITLTKTGNNIFTAPLSLPMAGQWNVSVLVKRPNNTIYQLKEKIFIPAAE